MRLRETSLSSLEDGCINGSLDVLLEEYIDFCYKNAKGNEGASDEKKSSKKNKNRFPNIAGFCRYLHIGNAEYEALASKYPEEFDRIRAVFEDEAFNSEVSPTLLSAYLKKRLGYEKSEGSEIYDGQLKVVFEHDIIEDGE